MHSKKGRMVKTSFRNKIASLCVIGMSLLTVSGCAPRGESHSVEQILTDARSAYQTASGSYNGEVAPALKTLSGSLDRLAGIGGAGDAKAISGEVATNLNDLSVKIGYTSRAAMAELVSQYRTIAEAQGSPVSIGAANLKLLAARTYSLLTAELKTTQFKIS
jgi:hypothetical protein